MERLARLKKYKSLRNKVTNTLRNDTINQNGKKIEDAKNENEIWNVI